MCNVILFVWNQLQHLRVAIVDCIISIDLYTVSDIVCLLSLLLCSIVVGTQLCGVVDTPPPVMTVSRI
jgi:hypothetical protein